MFFVLTDSLGHQHSQSEDTMTKLKQLLVKNKKELAENKKRDAQLQETISTLHLQLEEEKQTSETAKVTNDYKLNFNTSVSWLTIVLCRRLKFHS